MNVSHSIWVIKCRKASTNGSKGWHWNDYFSLGPKRANRVYEGWGGPDWIKNNLSRKLIRERFREGDLVTCYQCDHRQILGFTRLASNGRFSAFDLEPPSTAYVLKEPISVEQLRATGCKPVTFTRKLRGTVGKLSPQAMRGVAAAAALYNPAEADDLLTWLKAAGFGDGSRPPVKRVPKTEFKGENNGLDGEKLEEALRALEKKFANRDDVYVTATVKTIVRRDGPLINALKRKYDYRCQIPGCSAMIPKRDGGFYCEVGHVLAVAKGGGASRINLLVLCPNHHKAIDYGDAEVLENAKDRIVIRLNGSAVEIKR